MPDQVSREEGKKKLRELMDGINYGMLTTIDAGSLRSRPMAVLKPEEFNGELWFFTRASSHKVDEVEREHHVNVSFAEPKHNRYVSVSGLAQLVRDRRKNEHYWNPAYKAWFPDGLDDPDLALLKVDVDQAEYWDSPKSSMVHIAGFVKALATGTPAKGGENAQVKM